VTLISQQEVKAARRQHRCDWCETAINAGEPYTRQRYGGSDGPGVLRWHPECIAALDRLTHYEQEHSLFYAPYTRGCTCDRFDAARCNSQEFHAQEAKETP